MSKNLRHFTQTAKFILKQLTVLKHTPKLIRGKSEYKKKQIGPQKCATEVKTTKARNYHDIPLEVQHKSYHLKLS